MKILSQLFSMLKPILPTKENKDQSKESNISLNQNNWSGKDESYAGPPNCS